LRCAEEEETVFICRGHQGARFCILLEGGLLKRKLVVNPQWKI